MSRYVAIIVFFALFCFGLQESFAGGGHGHDDHHEEESHPEGKHGGRLLTEGDLGIEVVIAEQGILPEMRLFITDHGKPIAPSTVTAKVLLNRLGGEQDVIEFTPEQDYLVGNQVIREPHSYDVTLEATVEGKTHQFHYESHEGRVEVSDRLIERLGLVIEQVGAQTLTSNVHLYGIITPVNTQVQDVAAPFESLIKKVHVAEGDQVQPGQVLLTLTNTQTLKPYSLKSAQAGVVTHLNAVAGFKATNQVLMQIMDLSSVWVDLSAFPEAIEQLKKGQWVKVLDLHQHENAKGELIYVSPVMTGGHIARARALINNTDGHWRIGMHVKAQVIVAKEQVPMAVKRSALQTFRGMPVVFEKVGNTFEVRMVEIDSRLSDDTYVEVTGGIKSGAEYVTENSYLIKADILKSGASHHH